MRPRPPHRVNTQGALEDPFGLAIDSQNRLIVSCLEGYTIVRYDPSAEPNRQVWRATLAFVSLHTPL